MFFPQNYSIPSGNGGVTTHQGVVGNTTRGIDVTIPGDPCPWCRNTGYKLIQGDKLCSVCLLNHYDASYRFKNRAQRDSNNSLLCMGCREPFPYAEVDEDGRFKCYGCKSQDRIE